MHQRLLSSFYHRPAGNTPVAPFPKTKVALRPFKVIITLFISTLIVGLQPLMAPAALANETTTNLKISAQVQPNPVGRGTASRIIVEGLEPNQAETISGTFDGRPIFFFPSEDKYIGIFGVDVMLSPGTYPLEIKWPGGQDKIDVAVRDRTYGVRSIKVPDKQVNLSPTDRARADKERKLVLTALNTKSPNKLWQEPWQNPVKGQVNSSFGRQTRVNGILSPRPHAGADFRVGTGTNIKAPAPGLVVLAGSHFFAGKSVYIDHGQGLISMYFHLSDLKVKTGDMVNQGDLLGLSGATGRVTGPHLHYGVYIGGARVDPVDFHRFTTLLQPVSLKK